MAVTPYQAIAPEMTIIDSLIAAEQAIGTGKLETKKQMTKMEKKFQKEVVSAEKKVERDLTRRKKGWFEKATGIKMTNILPFLAFIPGMQPWVLAMLSGGSAVHELNEAERQAKWNIRASQKNIDKYLDPKWAKTFLSGPYTKTKSAFDKSFTELLKKADVKGMDLVTSGLGAAAMSIAMGKIGEKLGQAGESWKASGSVGELPAQAGAKLGPDKIISPGDLAKFGASPELANIAEIAQQVAPPGFDPNIKLGGLGERPMASIGKPSDIHPSSDYEAIMKQQSKAFTPGLRTDSTIDFFTKDLPALPGQRFGGGRLKQFIKELKKQDFEWTDFTKSLQGNEEMLKSLIAMLQYGQQQFED